MYTVGPKGQIVISKEIRERLGIEPGWMALQGLEDDHLVVYFLPPEHSESLRGLLKRFVPKDLEDLEWHEIAELAWEAAGRERGAQLARE